MITTTFYTSSFFNNSPIVNFSDTDDDNKQNVLDYQNLNTFWTVSSGSAKFIFIDTHPQNEAAYSAGRGQPSGSRRSVCILLNNYNDDMTGVQVIVYDSITNSSTIHVLANTTWEHGAGNPIFVIDLDDPVNRRYVRINFENTPVDAKISFIGIHNKRTIETRPEFPIVIQPEYYNDVVTLRGGKEYISSQAGNNTNEFQQRYTFPSTTNKAIFDNVFHDSNGRLFPLIYQPGENQEDAYFCRLTQDKLAVREIDHEYYRATLGFKTISFVEDGSNF